MAVLGVGSWGTALAVLAARRGHEVALWGWAPDRPDEIHQRRENMRYLKGIHLPENLSVTGSIGCVEGAELVIGAVPSGATRQVATLAAPHLGSDAAWVSATKGLEPVTCRRMTEVVSDVTRGAVKVAVLSGPSFAREVADGQHTAVVVACEDLEVARRVRTILSGPSFSAHASTDVIGVELGGALKNIVAIAAGMLVGLGHGHDAVAALITHGLRETTALCVALGARPETMTGLAGLGDLVLTCTGSASRNRRLGEMLARGSSLDEARRELGQVSEGVATTERALVEARTHGVDVPITLAVYEVLFDGRPPREAIEALLERHLGEEPS